MRIIDLTEDIDWAKKVVTILPCGTPEEPWEVYIDFKQYRLDYSLGKYKDKYYKLTKFGLGDEVEYEI